MKANELMIGDWVLSKSISKPCKVVGIDPMEGLGRREGYTFKLKDPNNILLFAHAVSVEPIPLTPEILEKNGFGKQNNYQWEYRDECCKIVISIAPQIEIDGEILGTPPIDINIEGALFDMSITNDYSVHELQHALRLCGIKKEITV